MPEIEQGPDGKGAFEAGFRRILRREDFRKEGKEPHPPDEKLQAPDEDIRYRRVPRMCDIRNEGCGQRPAAHQKGRKGKRNQDRDHRRTGGGQDSI